MTRLPRVRAVLFDLDGTFADTAPDLAYALNQTLQAYGEPPLPYVAIRPVASHGGNGLIKLGFRMNPDAPGFDERLRLLLNVYEANLTRRTRLFDGTATLINQLERCGIPWGIVTNKPAWLTDPLLARLGYASRAAIVISGDTCSRRKPHPEPILQACRALHVPAGQTLYVGDARRDIEAGRAAGSLTAVARFGYIAADDDPTTWDADVVVNDGAELIWLLRIDEQSTAD
jgi:phosphoglycolate phosphatase